MHEPTKNLPPRKPVREMTDAEIEQLKRDFEEAFAIFAELAKKIPVSFGAKLDLRVTEAEGSADGAANAPTEPQTAPPKRRKRRRNG